VGTEIVLLTDNVCRSNTWIFLKIIRDLSLDILNDDTLRRYLDIKSKTNLLNYQKHPNVFKPEEINTLQLIMSSY
jgi:hypothetical protein